MTRAHEIAQRTTPINHLVVCTCGWSFQTTRKQNAWARAAKVRGAIRQHCDEIEAKAKLHG
jgi:hypothetical protein